MNNIKNRNVYLMYAIMFLQGLVFYGPIATLYRQSRGLSMYQIFLVGAIEMVLMVIFEVPWGYIADKLGYKLILVLSNILFFVSKILFYKANSFWMFVAFSTIAAMAYSGISGCDTAFLYSSIEEEDSEKVFGRYFALSTAGFFTACILSTFLVQKSLNFTAYITIIPYGIALILTLFLKEVKSKEEEEIPNIFSSIKQIFKNKLILIFVFSTAAIFEVVHAVSIFLNQAQYIKSGIDIKYFGIISALVTITSMLSAKTYKITKRLGQAKTIKGLFIMIIVGCFSLVLTDNPILSVVLIAVIVGASSMSSPIVIDIENKSIVTSNRATILSVYSMFGSILGAGVNILIGKITEYSLESAFAACGIVSLIVLGLIIKYFNDVKKE